MKQLELTWEDIEDCLKQIPGLQKSEKYREFFLSGEGESGVHFFLVEFDEGEVIMPRGVHSDYAGILREGEVRVVRDQVLGSVLPPASCWQRPGGTWRRWLEERLGWRGAREDATRGWFARLTAAVLRRLLAPLADWQAEHRLANPYPVPHSEGEAGTEPLARVKDSDDFSSRIMGVTSVLWNLPRAVTLVAGTSCRLLLVKRQVLTRIKMDLEDARKAQIKKGQDLGETFFAAKERKYLEQTLPQRILDNRLLRASLYVEDIRPEGWKVLRKGLQGLSGPGARRFRALLDDNTKAWIDGLQNAAQTDGASDANTLDSASKYRLIKGVNNVLKRKDLHEARTWPPGSAGSPGQGSAVWTENEVTYRNMDLFAQAFPGALQEGSDSHPFSSGVARWFADQLPRRLVAQGKATPMVMDWLPKEEERRDKVVYRTGQPSDALYLILAGKLRVTREGTAGVALVNMLDRDGYFGESCLQENQTRRATVEAVTRCVLLKVPADLLREMTREQPALKQQLERENERMRQRDADWERARRRPPAAPPQEITFRLQRATNLLLIDMDRCTRCDQCVRACGEAHGDRPRFHRANPDYRFGKWEVAAACVHCTDAPCQHNCPVGAITFLETGAVQIHRNRCIGCTRCAVACPYGVIDMYPPLSKDEAPNLDRPAGKDEVATKCDLCLTEDADPPCVAACPYGAAQRGSPKDLFEGWNGFAEFADPR